MNSWICHTTNMSKHNHNTKATYPSQTEIQDDPNNLKKEEQRKIKRERNVVENGF